jgi:hypothetical protein
LIDLAAKIEIEWPMLEAKERGYWIDPQGLVWTLKDNGKGNWNEAKSICRELKLGGWMDWRLPSIEELPRIYESSQEKGKLKIKPPLQLVTGTAWVWSGTRDWTLSGPAGGIYTPRDAQLAWAFSFYTGDRFSFDLDDRYKGGLTIFCVRELQR